MLTACKDNQPSMARRVSDERESMHPRTEADLAKKDPTLPVYF